MQLFRFGPRSCLLSTTGALVLLVTGVTRADLDTRPLPITVEVAFPNLVWTGWKSTGEDGIATPLRPIMVTHAGDGANRLFVPTQQGAIHVFANDPNVKQTAVFLDLTSKVSYDDKTNEEGFLGLAFPPKYREKGRFFVYYTNTHRPHQNVLASYRVSKDDPNRADLDSEEILLTFKKPFWNHDGGTVVFGPDGYLYVALGDGGAANDPLGHGQRLNTWLGKILRIDVDHREDDAAYSIPKDNPFVGKEDARPEIWAYGLRNVWRMAFDRKTGVLWAADVGQDMWEEIDLIVKGGNYGWSVREARNPFGQHGSPPRPDLIEPIWEYHHNLGKSITGGLVYRGKQFPELDGAYLYADYVAGRAWALRYDPAQNCVTANREIGLPNKTPVMSFGEDQQGEVYLTFAAANGRGVLRLARAARITKR
jgi:glucose/arabinose dehydrogenase